MTKIILTAIMAVVWLSRTAAQPYCDVRTFTIRDGLAANTISSLTQSPDGLMWFSTWNGLCYYDGYRFTSFRNSADMGRVLSTNRVATIKSSPTGNIWCVTSDHHIYMFDTKECHFADVSKMIFKQYGHNVPVRNIYPLANGHTWITSNDGSANYRITDSTVLSGEGIEQYCVERGNLPGNVVKKAELDSRGREWVFDAEGVTLQNTGYSCRIPLEYMAAIGDRLLFASTTGRLYAFDEKEQSMTPMHMPEGVTAVNGTALMGDSTLLLATNRGIVAISGGRDGNAEVISVQTPAQPSAEATSLFVDSKRRIWAFTGSNGIVMLPGKGGQPRRMTAEAANLLQRTQSNKPLIHEDGHGTIWMVPTGGTFSYYDEESETLVPYTLEADKHFDIHLPDINKFMFDSDGNLWFTGTRDITMVNFRYHNFKFTPVQPGQDVRSLLTDSQGRTWAGTSNGQLAVFDSTHRLMGYADSNGRLHPTATGFSSRIYALHEDSKGRIWVGTKGNGIYVITGEGNVEHFTANATGGHSLNTNDIYDIVSDRHGRLWIAGYEGGLNLVDESSGGIRFINHGNGMVGYPIKDFGRIRRITQTDDGVMILSTTNGLVTFDGNFKSAADIRFYTTQPEEGDTTSLMTADVLQTLVMRSGRVLVVTLGGGIQQVTSAKLLQDGLKFCELPNIKPDEGMVQSIAEDNNGYLWIMRENNIDRYDTDNGELQQYGPGNIGGMELSEAKPSHDSVSDIITVAARGGIVSFNTGELKQSDYKPNIVFTKVHYHNDNKTVHILNKDELDVTTDRRNLTIYFSAIEYSYKDLVRYAYKIEGIDDNWIYTGTMNSASFNRLPHGRHRLLVRSTNSDGVWTDNTTALNIYAHPVFWETGWAWLLWFVLACGIIYVSTYIYRLHAKSVLERDLNDMKTRFFTEIAHKLRTPLTLIGGPVAEALRDSGMGDSARRHLEMVQRNASRMLELVNKMLKYNPDYQTYISDNNAATQMESGVADGETTFGYDHHAQTDTKLLVVEDNEDLRAFLVSILGNDYTILQAENGQRGLEIAEKQMPDFIITDVMMPVMDGLTMIHNIKKNKDICHIPIIVLSAKASLNDRLQGLKEGIDDYITKPFSATYLKMRVHNIISQRQILQQTYAEQLVPDKKDEYKLSTPQIEDADSEMMKKLMEYLENNIGDPDLKINDIAEAMNMSRSVFYSKIKSIVGLPPVDFLRHIRISRAEELVAKSNMSFSEIAYSIGFSDPKYFGRCFKKETGMSPSEYRNKVRYEQK